MVSGIPQTGPPHAADPGASEGAPSPFVHLHLHTEFSLLDGGIRIRDLIRKSKALGMDSVAITDHGNLFGAVQFYDEVSKAGIHPILGCEVYMAPGDRRDRTPAAQGVPTAFHLILLVMNETGYRNLSALITLAHIEGFYYHPRIDMELLRTYHEGLIALSACLKGQIPHLIQSGRMDQAREAAKAMASLFDRERFYLEIQANTMPEQEQVNRGLQELAGELSLPLVATNDCHYLDRQDAETQDVLLCIQTGKTVGEEKRLRFSNNHFYFKTFEEMRAALPGCDEALRNTRDVAARCTYGMEFGRYKYPVFLLPTEENLDAHLKRKADEGLTARLTEKARLEGPLPEGLEKEYRERLAFERDTILRMGFAGYFLIVADLITYARGQGIPVGPGRGSAAGSLVAYCLWITDVDPMKYGLLFERFLNPERISMPDIDIDFCMNRRDEVIRYVAEKYGRGNVGQIITFGTMKARGVIRDVGRTLGVPLAEVDRIAKLVPEGPGVKLEDAIEAEPELKRMEEEGGTPGKLLKISRALEGMARHVSTHASGIVISDRPLVEYLPLYKGPKGEIMTQFTMNQIEKLGLIKFDFLGLTTLSIIKQALDLIEETTGRTLDIRGIPLDDPETFALICEGKTTGVFQLESTGMKDLLRRLRPEVFEDVIALMALYRPGPLGSNMIDAYIAGKHGESRIRYMVPQLEPILKDTYGIILYQEQVMRISQVLAGYSKAEADELRKAIGKKKPEVMVRHRSRFLEGAVQGGLKARDAEKIFELIEKFGGYGFNKAHSAAYALIAFQTGYLKAHHPVEFMAAVLSQEMGTQDKTIKNIAECRNMGIQVLPPDINESQADFSISRGKIRFGLAAIKNVGLKAVEVILSERRDKGLFRDLADFCRRVDTSKVNKRVVEALIEGGAFDFSHLPRACLFASLEEIYRLFGTREDPNQLSMFQGSLFSGPAQEASFAYPQIKEWDDRERLRREKEALGFYVTGHPLDRFNEVLRRFTTSTLEDLQDEEERSTVKVAGIFEGVKYKRTKKGDKMAIFHLEDMTGSVEVVLFPDAFQRCAECLQGDEPILVTGTLERTETASKIIAQDIARLESLRARAVERLEIPLQDTEITEDLLEDMKQTLVRYPGECRLLFRLRQQGGEEVLVAPHERYRVLPCPEFLRELKGLLKGEIREVPQFP